MNLDAFRPDARRPRRALIALVLVAVAGRQTFAANGPPNVVVVLIDDLGATDLGCYGSKFYRTPNVDRLAAEGMRFTQAYSACPVCSPTRAALMTGRYPARLHLTDYLPGQADRPAFRLRRPEFRQNLALEEVTLGEVLRDAGYATTAIGKWHLGGQGYDATRQGFETSIAGNEIGSPASYFAPFRDRIGRAMPGLEEAPEGQYLTDRLTLEALKFIDANKDRPFFLYLPHFAVHTPLVAKAEMIGVYESAPKPPGLQQNAIYAAMVESMDQSIGRISGKLAEHGLTDNTIVVFSSDNGGLATTEGKNTPATNNAPLREGKGYLYEGGIRVPLIVKWPGAIQPGTQSNVATSSIDLLPTIAELCGAKLTATVDGVSLASVARGAGHIASRPLYWHYPHYSPQGGRPGGAIREGDYKLIEFYEHQRHELFNIATDVSENTNLVDREPARSAQMAARLAAWRQAVDAQMPSENPDYQPNPQEADGVIMLPGATAEMHGVMVRYEPLPHKRTIGFWVRGDDWVSWDFDVATPGAFTLETLVGCGAGSGGSVVDFAVGDQTLSLVVDETGGFQNFVSRSLGTIKLASPGRYALEVKPRSKPGPAVMDLRQVKLVPAAPARP
jgi:arylsulfatase A